MHKAFFVFLSLVMTASVAGAAALEAGPADPFSGFPGMRMSEREADSVFGGDVRMRLNGARNRLEVEIISNEYEARLGRIPPVARYEVDVHNRVADTNRAPFLPAASAWGMVDGYSGLSSRPAAFPSGYWEIGRITERTDAYGPFMISTNAVGTVEVYGSDGRGGRTYLGTLPDTGYALHSNAKPFESSLSYGCLVLRQDDVSRIANDIMADRMSDRAARASLRVRGDR